jgi:hypothetical protein
MPAPPVAAPTHGDKGAKRSGAFQWAQAPNTTIQALPPAHHYPGQPPFGKPGLVAPCCLSMLAPPPAAAPERFASAARL